MGRMETLDQWIIGILGSGLLGTLVLWRTTRHKPGVDTAQVVLTGQRDFIDNLQEERDRLDLRIDKMQEERDREREQQNQRMDAIEARAAWAEQRASAAERSAANAAAENLALLQHHLDTLRGVAVGAVPPWLPIPSRLAHLMNLDDLPVIKPKEDP